MKLLDLQRGKYLELGKEWGYFGEYITLIQIHTKTLIGTPYTRPLSPTHAPDYPTIQVEEILNESKVCIYNHTNPIINQVAGKVGAVVYGGRYVLLENEKCGNIYCEKNKWGTVYYLNKNIYSFIPCLEFNPQNDKKQTVARFFSLDNCQDDLIGNIFEEYSKQFRNEPNKFEELQELIK